MCTMTWTSGPGALEVFFNRDEKRNRMAGLPPAIRRTANGTLYLSPLDADRGGAWIAANEHGLVATVLNYYQAEFDTPVRGTSRGELPLLVMDARRIAEAELRLTESMARRYKAFWLVLLAPDGTGRQCIWDGIKYHIRDLTDADLPVTTSSFETSRVTAHRRELLTALRGSADATISTAALEAYHLQPGPPGMGAYGVCMARPDAQSVSFTRVRVEPGRVSMEQAPLNEGKPGPRTAVTLPRANAGRHGLTHTRIEIAESAD